MRIDNIEDYKRLLGRDVKPVYPPKKTKFGAIICEADGIKFRSKKERQRYLELVSLTKLKTVKFFLRQVPFYLPGGVKYLLDFLVFWDNGTQTFEDVKGMKTPMFIMKKKQVEALYPIQIIDPYARWIK